MNILSYIERHELRSLTTPSNRQAVWVVACNAGLIAAAFALPALWHNPAAWVLASVVLAGRALGLGILTHEAAHLTFFRSRKLNEWAGIWLFGALPNVPYHGYRRGHLQHHRALGTGQDPDLAFVDGYPATRASLLRKLLRDVSGINGVKNVAYQMRSNESTALRPFLLAHALLFGALWAAGIPQVYACWWIGMIFVYPLLLRLRVMAEHGGLPDAQGADLRENTGTTLAGPLARLLVAPNRVNYHVEHHLAASVPCYRLPAMHKLLVARGFYEGAANLAPSYWHVVRRCMARDGQAAVKRRVAKGALDNMR
ncbi:fatty acid desaturase family protein [Pseudoduganella sp. RAF53_2]|uniref:fatty acid desaturase family protein n=1 Tax=unclassified Pseudoduganella TaxID=2637179 RepID=UPI003F989001